MSQQKIGIMGGSFDPIHERHIDIAKFALREASLDSIVFIPTGNPPHKNNLYAPPKDRMRMICLAAAKNPYFKVSDIEYKRTGTIYTADTLQILTSKAPNIDYYYIIGEDTLNDLPHWYYPEKVFKMCTFIVCKRSSQNISNLDIVKDLEKRGAKFKFLSLEAKDISSSNIRQLLAEGSEPGDLNVGVYEYIRIMGLYGVMAQPTGMAQHMDKLFDLLTYKRMLHSLSVVNTARKLARIHGINEEKAATAGLLHDCAKCLSLGALQRIAKENKLVLDDVTMNSSLLHAPVSALFAQTKFEIHDEEILSAIAHHTTGIAGMSKMDMIIYLADKIEVTRSPYPELESIRAASLTDLRKAMKISIESTSSFLLQRGNSPHENTTRLLTWLSKPLQILSTL